MIEGLLVDSVEIFVHELLIINVFGHFNKVYLFKVLFQEFLCVRLFAGSLQSPMHVRIDLFVIRLP